MTDQPTDDQTPAEVQQDENVASTPAPVTASVDPSSAPEPADGGVTLSAHDEEDVDAALGRKTQDGPGFGDESQLPESDFDGFASDDVEEEK